LGSVSSCFISYSRRDSEFVHRLFGDLKAAGVDLWLDDLDIGSEHWDLAVQRALEACQFLIVVLSPASADNNNVLNEVDVGLKEKKVVIPVRIEECRLPLLVRRINYIDFVNSSYDEGLKKVLRAIRVSPPEPLPQPAMPRMLDAGIPGQVVKGEPTELLVMIRLPDSAGLAGRLLSGEETGLSREDLLSKSFSITFPVDVNGSLLPLKVAIHLTSPDFSPGIQSKNIFVPPDGDSDPCRFMLTPVRLGRLKVLVELQWEDATRGQRSLVTECVAVAVPEAGHQTMNVVQIPITVRIGSARIMADFTTLTQSMSPPHRQATSLESLHLQGLPHYPRLLRPNRQKGKWNNVPRNNSPSNYGQLSNAPQKKPPAAPL
jgi:hypothetical protein